MDQSVIAEVLALTAKQKRLKAYKELVEMGYKLTVNSTEIIDESLRDALYTAICAELTLTEKELDAL